MVTRMLGAQGTKITQADWEKVANFVHPHSVTDTLEVAGGAYSGTFVHRGVEGEITAPVSLSTSGNFIRRGVDGLEAGTGQPLTDDLYTWDGTKQRTVRGYGEVTVRGVRGNESHPVLVTEPGQHSNVYAEYHGGEQVKNAEFIERNYETAQTTIPPEFTLYAFATNVNGTGTPNHGFTRLSVDHVNRVTISSRLRITNLGLTYWIKPVSDGATQVVGIAFKYWPGTLVSVAGEGATFSISGGLNSVTPLTAKLSPKIWQEEGFTYRIAHLYRVDGTTLTPLAPTVEQDVSVSMQIITRH